MRNLLDGRAPDILRRKELSVFGLPLSRDRDPPNRFTLLRMHQNSSRFAGIICRVTRIDLELHALSLDQQAARAFFYELDLCSRIQAIQALLGCDRNASQKVTRRRRRRWRLDLRCRRRNLLLLAPHENKAARQDKNTHFHRADSSDSNLAISSDDANVQAEKSGRDLNGHSLRGACFTRWVRPFGQTDSRSYPSSRSRKQTGLANLARSPDSRISRKFSKTPVFDSAAFRINFRKTERWQRLSSSQ